MSTRGPMGLYSSPVSTSKLF